MRPSEKMWFDETLRMRCADGKVPTRLYKFLASDSKHFSRALHELMIRARIRRSSRNDFNDPFDTSFALDFPDSDEMFSRCMEGIVRGVLASEHFRENTQRP